MSKQMYIRKEESHLTTPRSIRGTSNIDLTIIKNQLLNTTVQTQEQTNRHREQIKLKQINLQHSRVSNDNLMQIIAQQNTDMVMIQKRTSSRTVPKESQEATERTPTKTRNRAAIIITNNTIDAILLTQYKYENTILLETHSGKKELYPAKIYMDYKEEIGNILKK